MKKREEFTLDEIKNDLSDKQNQILDLYLQRYKQKEIIEQIGCTRSQIDNLVRKYKLTRFRSRNNFTLDETILDINNPEFCYFLGWFASDGNLHTTNSGSEIILFTLKDREPLDIIKNILKYTGEVKEYTKKGKTNYIYKENYEVQRVYYFLGITNKALVTTINSIFNMDTHRKTYTLTFPTFPNEECLRMFIRGFWDGDGCFTYSATNNNSCAAAHCASILFCKQFCENLNNLGIDAMYYDREPCPEIRIYRKESFKKYIYWLYTGFESICLSRKKEKAYNLLLNY